MRLWGELENLHRSTGVTTLHVTHDRAEAAALAQRIGIIRDGRIEQVGEKSSIFERPDSRFVAEFTGGTNVYRGSARANGGLCEFESPSLTLVTTARLAGPCWALVRPENIILSRMPLKTSARNQIEGVVQSVTGRNGVFEVTARFADSLMTSLVTSQSVEELEIAPGVRVYFSFKAGSVHLFRSGSKEETNDLA